MSANSLVMRCWSCLMIVLLASCSSLSDRAPMRPEIFGPGTVSTRAREFATSFSRDGRTVYVNLVEDDRIYLVRCHADGDTWTAQERVPFSDGSYPVVDPFVSFDGSRLYFSSNGPPGAKTDDYGLWYVERSAGEWAGDPHRIHSVESPGSDVFCTLTSTGVLYFSSRAEGKPRVLMAARPKGDAWHAPQPVDLGLGDASVGNPLIAPDESFLIFTADLPGGFGAVDLYMSRRKQDGSWGKPVLLPEPINSKWRDFAPALSPDGRALFFTSERPGMVPEEVEGRRPGDIYWVRFSALEL